MATVKKCDRCGKYYDTNSKYSNELYSLNQQRNVCGISTLKSYGVGYEVLQDEEYDLCDKCLEAFYDWLEYDNTVKEGEKDG